jgi:hypothetical protein
MTWRVKARLLTLSLQRSLHSKVPAPLTEKKPALILQGGAVK